MADLPPFSAQVRDAVHPGVVRYLDAFEQGARHLQAMCPHVAVAFEPPNAPRALHNHYVDLLLATYLAKYSLFAEQLVSGLNRFDLLAYGAAARGLLEMTAVLRHYVIRKYKPILDAGTATGTVDLRELITLHDQHLRGTRFDWDAFATGDLSALIKEAQIRLTSNRNAQSEIGAIRSKQVNVNTCIEHWAREAPIVLVLYDLLCDLVHPNLGRALAAASSEGGRLVFGRVTEHVAAMNVFDHTFPWLVSACMKSFGDYFEMLMFSKYTSDEL